jgi:hypothetical protein
LEPRSRAMERIAFGHPVDDALGPQHGAARSGEEARFDE